MNQIPGSDTLGYGFNILGAYDTSSVTSQLFEHLTNDSKTWTYQPTGITYQVADNIAIFEDSRVSGKAHAFASQQEFQSYFAASAGINGSYNAFEGEFNAAYGQLIETGQSSLYGLYEADYRGWRLSLQDESDNFLSPAFLSAANALPATFSPETQEKFFTFLRQYGTHYVAEVTMGGNLTYFVAIAISQASTIDSFEANVSLEYKAVFSDASAEATVDWQTLGKQWAASRTVTVSAVGGDTSPLAALDPSFGDNEQSIFTTWKTAIMQNPADIGFKLRSISLLVADDARRQAVEQAIQAYTNPLIYASVNFVNNLANTSPAYGQCWWTIEQSGNVILPDPNPTPPTPPAPFPPGGIRVVLFDSTSLQPFFSKIYFVTVTSGPQSLQIYQDIMKDLSTVNQKNYFATVAICAIPLWVFPIPAFAAWLQQCGAGLEEWQEHLTSCATDNVASYILVGRTGVLPGMAVEKFALWIDVTNAYARLELSAALQLSGNQV